MHPLSELERPAAHAEHALVSAILNGDYPAGAALPAERELAGRLGITRPTLREALQRLARDGWLTIQHGKATVINDFWREGGLGVLNALAHPHNSASVPTDFIPNLLEVRSHLAPVYTEAAVRHAPQQAAALLHAMPAADASAAAFADFDWHLQHGLTIASGNPIYTLILNGFAGFYQIAAQSYFNSAEARAISDRFYHELLAAAEQHNPAAAANLTHRVMETSTTLWLQLAAQAATDTRGNGKPPAP
ncbi:MAG: fatty acid metabolism transcriptional regulator FadR [Caldilineales bacterium]